MQSVYSSALLQNVWSKRPLAIVVWLVAIDDHQAGPIEMAIVLEQLFILFSLRAVIVNSLLFWIEQCVTVLLVVRLGSSEQTGPHIRDSS